MQYLCIPFSIMNPFNLNGKASKGSSSLEKYILSKSIKLNLFLLSIQLLLSYFVNYF